MQDVTLDFLEHLNCPHCGASFDTPLPEAFAPISCERCGESSHVPGKFGQFLLFECQGESITSVMFDAFDPKLGRNVTLKILNYVLSKNPELVNAFKHEALAAAALNSTFVLKVYEFGLHNRQPFMVMEHIEGKFLHEVMQQEQLSEFRILEITEGIVQGLQDMHERGIMHGDVMPRNILIHTDGTPRISDFGLARFSEQDPAETSRAQWESWSSPYYMPPERIEGKKEDYRGDFYSLGTTLYNLLTGELPFFDMDESKVLERKTKEDPPDPRVLNPEISDGMAELAGILLQRDPEDRPTDYEDLRVLILELKRSMPRPERVIPEPDQLPDYQQPPVRKKKESITWFVFLVLIGILGAMLVSLPKRNRESRPIELDPTPVPRPAVPTPTPPPAPVPTSTPVPTPTPPPLPTSTPVPLPSDPLNVRGLEFYLTPASLPQKNGAPIEEWTNFTDGKVIFSQSEKDRRPTVELQEEMPPVLRFSGSRMDSSRQIWDEKTFTLLTIIRISDMEDSKQPMVILGGDLQAATSGRFSIQTEPHLPNSFRFTTDKGSALITLPFRESGKPIVLGFRRGPAGDKAYLGNFSSELSTELTPVSETDPDRFTGLQLGGIEGEKFDFSGWMGEIQMYRRALSDQEIGALTHRLKNRYGENP